MSVRTLVYNGATCHICGNTIVSYHRHDFKWCSCKSIAIDGGVDYVKMTGDPVNYTPVRVYSDESHEKVRQYAYRTGNGKPGSEDYGKWRVTIIKDMDDSYLEQSILYVENMIHQGENTEEIINHLEILKNERNYRKNNS